MSEQPTITTKVDLKTAIRHFTEVQKHIELNKALPWHLSKDAIKAAVAHHSAPESQGFIADLLPRVIAIMLSQSPARLGVSEREILEDGMYQALCIVLVRLKDFPHLVSVVARIFDPKLPYYQGSKTGFTFSHGFPAVRLNLAKKFAELRGFQHVADALKRSDLVWPGCDTFSHLIVTMVTPDVAPIVVDDIKRTILEVAMERVLSVPDDLLKKESTDSLSNLIRAVSNLYCMVGEEPTTPSRDEPLHNFCFQIVFKCITSSSLITKLFGYDQLNDLIGDIKSTRPLAGSYIVQNAGTECVNGLYIIDENQDLSAEFYHYVKPSQGSDTPMLTLFRCTMRNTKAKWWFISHADSERPGTDRDIDYYLHRSSFDDEREPPIHGWQRSNAGMKLIGVDPVPILRRGKPFFQDPTLTPEMFADHSFLRWALSEDDSCNLVTMLFTVSNMHREIIARAEKFLVFLIEYEALTEQHVLLMWRAVLNCHDLDIIEELLVLFLHLLPLLSVDLQELLSAQFVVTVQGPESSDQYHKLALLAEKMCDEHCKYVAMLPGMHILSNVISFAWSMYRHSLFETQKNNGFIMELLSFCFSTHVGRELAIERIIENVDVLVRASASTGVVSSAEEDVSTALNILLFIISKLATTDNLVDHLDRACSAVINEVLRYVLAHRDAAGTTSSSSSSSTEEYLAKLSVRFQVLQKYLHHSFQHYRDGATQVLASPVWQGVRRIFGLALEHPLELEAFFTFLKALYHANSATFSAQSGGTSAISTTRHVLHFRIFSDFLCSDKVPWATVQANGFECFSAYFNDLEYFNNVFMQVDHADDPPPIKSGVCTLWRMVFNIVHANSAKSAIDLLLSAYEGLADSNNRIFTPKEILNIIFAQLDRCGCGQQQPPEAMQDDSEGRYDVYINTHINTAEQSMWVCNRSLQVLQQAIQKFNNSALLVHYACLNTARFSLSVTYKRVSYYYNSVTNSNSWRTEKGTDGVVQVEVHPFHSLKQLKSKVIDAAGLDRDVKITFDHLTLTPAVASAAQGPNPQPALSDSTRLRDLGLHDNQEIVASYEIVHIHHRADSDDGHNSYGQVHDSLDGDGVEEDSSSIGVILAEDFSKFDTLLTMCQYAGEHNNMELRSRIWDVLMQIPTQCDLLGMIQNAFEDSVLGVDEAFVAHSVTSLAQDSHSVWSRLFANPVSPRTAYMLQMMDRCVNPAAELEELRATSDGFRRCFVLHGCVEGILEVLLALPRVDDVVINASFAVLLHLLQHLLGLPAEEPAHELDVDDSMLSSNTGGVTVSLALSDADNAALLQQLLYATHLAARTDTSDMVEHSLFVIINTLKQSHTMSAVLTTNPNARELVKRVLTHTNKRVREMALNFTHSLGRYERVVASWVVSEVLSDDILTCAHSSELFAACKSLLSEPEEVPGLDLLVLCEHLRAKILCFRGLKVEDNSVQLHGYLDLYKNVLKLHPHVAADVDAQTQATHTNFMTQLLKQYLFFLPGSGDHANGFAAPTAVCDSPQTRAAAFEVLLAYAKVSLHYYHVVLDEVQRLVKLTAKHLTHTFNMQISYDIKTPSIPHTGLKNQGCTCYLNSLLQLMYGSTGFREQLLALPIKAVHRTTLWHMDNLDLVGCFVLFEWSATSAGVVAPSDGVQIYGTAWRLGKCIGYDAESSSHRIQYFDAQSFDLDEVAHFNIHSGRYNKETGRVKLVPAQLLTLGQRDGPDQIRALLASLAVSADAIWCLNEREEAALRVVDQLQRTFLHLQQSQRKFYDPRPLVDACKTLNLNYNIYHQNDAAEFYDQLLDRIETVAKSKEITGDDFWTNVFSKALFGGVYVTQKVPQDCEAFKQNKEECGHHQSARKEMFLKIEMLIRGKDNINDSLRELVAGEVFDGDNKISCDVCNEKKTTTRFTCLETLPNVLVLHLKRFDLDFTTFETVKLNTRMAFPVRMNLYPFTKDGLDEEMRKKEQEVTAADADATGEEPTTAEQLPPAGLKREDCDYTLQGVLVHAGIAQGGHYYSFVKAGGDDDDMREKVQEALTSVPSSAEEARASGKWFRFDDEDVSPFDSEHIPYHCFGGPAHTGGSTFSDEERSANALMLLYSKCSPTADGVAVTAPHGVPAGGDEFVSGARAFAREVQEANLQHLLTCYMVDPELHLLLTDMLRLLIPSEGLQVPPLGWSVPTKNAPYKRFHEDIVLQLDDTTEDVPLHTTEVVVSYLLDVLLHIRERPALRDMVAALKDVFAAYHYTAYWFVHSLLATTLSSSSPPTGWFTDFLVHCTDALARNAFVQICANCCTVLCSSNSPQALQRFNGVKLLDIKREVAEGSVTALMGLFLRSVVDLVFRVPSHTRTADEVFVLLRDLCAMPSALHAMQSLGVVSHLCYFVVPDLVAPAVANIFERMMGPPKAGAAPYKDYTPLHGSVFEAISALLGVPVSSRANLLQEKSYWDAELTGDARDALAIIFHESSRAGVMDAYDLSSYFDKVNPVLGGQGAATGGKNHSVAVRNIMDRYGGDGKLRLEGFLQFHADTASYNPKGVWKDLQAFGFQNDLSRRSPAASSTTVGAVSAAPLAITESCRLCLSHLVFYEQGLLGCEAAARAIAQRICSGNEIVSRHLLTEALQKLLSISCENSWVPNAALVVQDFLRLLLSIDDGLMHTRLHIILVDKHAGLVEVILRERVKPTVCRANDYNKGFLRERYVSCVQDLVQVPGVAEAISQLAAEDARIASVRGMLKRPGSQLTEDEDSLVRGTTVRVEGAGADHVNGDYVFEAVKNGAGFYLHAKEDRRYTLYKCSLENGGYQWYLSITPHGLEPGTKNDVDFYCCPAKHSDRLPPTAGWTKFSGSVPKNLLHHALDPAPRMTYLHAPDLAVPVAFAEALSFHDPHAPDLSVPGSYPRGMSFGDDGLSDALDDDVDSAAGIYASGMVIDSSDDEGGAQVRDFHYSSSTF